MNSNIKLLAMDFDGVIADSILECAVVGYNGYAEFCNKLDQLTYSPNQIDMFQLAQFRSTRPFIRSGEDYIYLFQAINEKVTIDSQIDFDRFRKKFIDRRELYYKLFYSAREELMTNHFDKWIALNLLYDGMKDFLNSKKEIIQIISTKSKKYIIEILNNHCISIDEQFIHSTEQGKSKSDILISAMRANNIIPENTIYIDDHYDTLLNMKSTEVQCLLANWGYNAHPQNTNIQDSNIISMDLIEFYDKLDKL